MSTNRPSSKNACAFNVTTIFSEIDKKMVFDIISGNWKCNGNHKGHAPVHRTYISQSITYSPIDVDTFIQVSLQNHVSSGTIYQLVLQLCHRNINEFDILSLSG